MSDVIGTYYQYGFIEDKFGNFSYRPSLKAEGIALNLNFVEAFLKEAEIICSEYTASQQHNLMQE